MNGNFLKNLEEFFETNFNYDPKNYKELSDTLFGNSQNEEDLMNLGFPKDELSNIFNYETLFLLLKTEKDFRDNHKELIKNILIVIYNFYSGNKFAFEYLDIKYTLPLKKYSQNIEEYTNKLEYVNCFFLFNFALININNDIEEKYYENDNFIMLDILLLYNYAFIHNKIRNINNKQAIISIIIILINIYNKSSKDNSIAFKLASFLFENGKTNCKFFLVPENIDTKGYKEFDELIQTVKKSFDDVSIVKDILVKIEELNMLHRIKLFKEDDFEETEISSEDKNTNNEELNKNNNERELNNNKELNLINNNEKLNINNNVEELNISNNKGELNKNNDKVEININNNNEENNKHRYKDIDILFENMDNVFKQINKLNEEKSEQQKLITFNSKEINKLNKVIVKLTDENVQLKESDKEKTEIILAQNRKIDNLHGTISILNTTIEKNEKNIKELKTDLSKVKKELKNTSTSLSISQTSVNTQLLSLKNYTKKINELTLNSKTMMNKIEKLEKENKTLNNKIDLIGSRDFLRKIFFDFCYLFGIFHVENYEETAKQIIDIIKQGNIDSSIKIFTQKVNLIEFIDFLGKIINESDNLSHYLFPELSIKFRDSNLNDITNIKNIENNIDKCRIAFNQYSKMDFDSIFSFFINNCKYPVLIKNKLDISDSGLKSAIQDYNNTK